MNEPANFVNGQNGTDGVPPGEHCTMPGESDYELDNPPYQWQWLLYKTICLSAIQYAGRHYDVHNLYGYFMIKATNECACN